jgi:uncharacterized membrane protein
MQAADPDFLPVTTKTRPDLVRIVLPTGRILFATAIIALGMEHLITGNFPVALLPFPAGFPGRSMAALLIGIILIITGLSIGFRQKAYSGAIILGIVWLLSALYLHAPTVLANIHNGGAWTVLSELMALSAGAFYLAGITSLSSTTQRNGFNLMMGGKVLFAVALVIFGILHFQYADYVATLVPSWIPAHLFWAYFVGVAFVATAISLILNRQRTLSTGLLGLMFLFWVVLLHAPRAIAKLQSEPEWTSLFIALAMSGIAFMMAGSQRRTNSATKNYRMTITD